MNIKGILPVSGVEYELRPATVRDTVELYDDPTTAQRCEKNNFFYRIAMIHQRIVLFGGKPKQEVTIDQLLELDDSDGGALLTADTRGSVKKEPDSQDQERAVAAGVGTDETGI